MEDLGDAIDTYILLRKKKELELKALCKLKNLHKKITVQM